MKKIYRSYEDTEVSETSTHVKCPYCGSESLESGTDECGKTYIVECEECEKEYEMHFDA